MGRASGSGSQCPGAGGAWGRRARAARGSPGAAASAPAVSAATATRAARLGDEEQDAASAGPGPNGCGHPGTREPSAAAAAAATSAASGMDQCVTVERELEKVLHKFSGYGQLCERGLEELIDYTGGLKHEILQSHGRAARVGARGRARPLGPRRASRSVPAPPPPPQTPVTFPPLDLPRSCTYFVVD